MPKDRLVHGLPTDFFGRLETPCPYWAIFLLSPGPYWAGIGWCLFDRIAFLSTLVLMTAWGISRARRRSRRLEHAIAAVMLSHWPHPTEPAPLLLNSGE